MQLRQRAMKSHVQRHQRIRTLAMSVGMVLGMFAATFAPQLAHASAIKAAKAGKPRTLVEKITQLPEATVEQLQAAERVLTGHYECEFGKRVAVDRSASHQGYFNLQLGKQSWLMKPVLSSTGAIRLEDIKGATLLLQILTKSMLMDVKAGHRLVDGCVLESQRAAADDLARNPRPSAFDLAPRPDGQ
jgi:hypothetical protein